MFAKLINFTLACLVFSFNALAQDVPKKNTLQLGYAFGDATLSEKKSMGAGSRDVKSYSRFALEHIYMYTAKIGLETGIHYQNLEYWVTGAPTGQPVAAVLQEASLLSVPLKLRYAAWDIFFLNAGVLADFDLTSAPNYSPLSGLGLSAGIGFKYDHSSGLGIFINPQLNARTLIPFTARSSYRLFDATVNTGVSYSF